MKEIESELKNLWERDHFPNQIIHVGDWRQLAILILSVTDNVARYYHSITPSSSDHEFIQKLFHNGRFRSICHIMFTKKNVFFFSQVVIVVQTLICCDICFHFII